MPVENGISPFRGNEGLWSCNDPMTLAIDFFRNNSLKFWKVTKEIFCDFFGKANQMKNIWFALK